MKRITIKIPQKETDKWSVSFSKGLRKRNSAMVVYKAVKRHLQARAMRDKIVIKVVYGKDRVNETIPSIDASYLTYATACFLEDYLSIRWLSKEEKERNYGS